MDDNPRELWYLHLLLELAINHNQSSHGHGLGVTYDNVPSCMKKYDEFLQLFCSWMSDLVMNDIFIHEEDEYGTS